MLIPNLESICPTEILEFPPAITCGFILIQTGISGCLLPNCSKMDRLSMLIRTPNLAASSIVWRKYNRTWLKTGHESQLNFLYGNGIKAAAQTVHQF